MSLETIQEGIWDIASNMEDLETEMSEAMRIIKQHGKSLEKILSLLNEHSGRADQHGERAGGSRACIAGELTQQLVAQRVLALTDEVRLLGDLVRSTLVPAAPGPSLQPAVAANEGTATDKAIGPSIPN